MSRVRLYLDEDAMRRSLVFGLRARGIDLETAAEAGMINRPDEEHLAYASEAGRTLLSYNACDYCSIHQLWLSAGRAHAGIIVAPQQQYSTGEELRRITRLISRRAAADMRDRLEFLSSWA